LHARGPRRNPARDRAGLAATARDCGPPLSHAKSRDFRAVQRQPAHGMVQHAALRTSRRDSGSPVHRPSRRCAQRLRGDSRARHFSARRQRRRQLSARAAETL